MAAPVFRVGAALRPCALTLSAVRHYKKGIHPRCACPLCVCCCAPLQPLVFRMYDVQVIYTNGATDTVRRTKPMDPIRLTEDVYNSAPWVTDPNLVVDQSGQLSKFKKRYGGSTFKVPGTK
eukprot:m.86160 g.86160  ORF g.86160 m.86160 type:complete len:121 (-) comp50907_c0_seq1:73-435(-)